MPNAYTPKLILKKILDVTGATQDLVLHYEHFRKIMMVCEDCEPVIHDKRTCKDKYNLLIDGGYISSTEVLIYDRAIQKVLE